MPKQLTAEMMADIKAPFKPQISPDGSWVVVSVGTNAKLEEHRQAALWLADAGGQRDARQITSGLANDTAPRWSPDGRQIAFLSDRVERGTPQLYLMPFSDGGEALALTEERGGVSDFRWLPGERPRIAYLTPDARDPEEEERRKEEKDDPTVWGAFWPYARLKVIDVDSGGVRQIDLGERHAWSMSPSPDGGRLAVTTSETPELESRATTTELAAVDLESGEVEIIFRPGFYLSSLTWSAAGDTLYYIAPGGAVPAVSSDQLWMVEATPDAGPRLVTMDLTACLDSLARGSGDVTLYAVVIEGVDTGIFALNPANGQLAERLHFDGDLSAISVSDDGSAVAVIGSTIDRPYDIYAGPPGGELRRVTDFHRDLDDVEFGPYEVVTWDRVGARLDGIVLWPPGKGPDDGPLPTAVSIHGGPYGRWARAFSYGRPFGHWLAAQGYLVFLPNARGGAGHGQAFAEAVLDSVGKEDWPDILAGIDLIVERGWADPDRMGIGGWSQGGFMTAWAIGHDPEDGPRFKCAVMGAGVSDWGMMIATSDLPTFEARLGGGNPYESIGPHEFDKWSPVSYVHRARTPTLILHGENDERVPVGQAIFMHRGLRQYDVETELVIYPREPHGIQERRHVIDLHERIAAWYRRWIPVED